MNTKQKIYFGPPLARLTEGRSNTLEVSSKINLAAERYMAILSQYNTELSPAEENCLRTICGEGTMMLEEIESLADEVSYFSDSIEGLDPQEFSAKLKQLDLAGRIALIESLEL